MRVAAGTTKDAITQERGFRRRYILEVSGGVVMALWIMISLMGPSIVPYPPNAVDVTAPLHPPAREHLLGTDQLGRDILSRVLMGARVSIPAGLVVVMIAGVCGSLYGGGAAYAGGMIEERMMRVTDLFFCFPPLILAMAIASALGVGWGNTVLAMMIVWWPKYARLSCSLVLGERAREYVESAVAVGGTSGRILVRHIAPNTLGPLVTFLTLDIGSAIITFSGLSFLGLGVVPPTPEWGSMVSQGQALIQQWWVSAFPGLAIFTVVMGCNFLGDGIRDWLDPHSKGR